MPDISLMNLPSFLLNAKEIYDGGIFDPNKSNPDSFEILNGGLDSDNYGGGEHSIPAWACQIGSFAYGFYQGFERHDFVYARQMSKENKTALGLPQRSIHAGLTAKAFLPWDASVLLYGFQAFFKQDATNYVGNDSDSEYYDIRVDFDGTPNKSMSTHLPRGRWDSGYTSTPNGVAGMHEEEWWRYVSKQTLVENVSKGYRTIDISVWSEIYVPGNYTEGGQYDSKLITPSGAVWMLAIR
tara:strand:+ start:10010 stop:10729 length:720 start_codon:yes stop_codon:yes gene_type:complete